MIGGAAADGIFYSDVDTPADQMGQIVIEIPADRLYSEPPENMCLPSDY
ncbi:hypothetical protein [Erythrobacter sp. JK5]|nr:hypothetical protein [Erythrobacter sp. JK5]QUL38972.1 hypothetical protein KDC96_06385 [Erythrobacter sp. JK5]